MFWYSAQTNSQLNSVGKINILIILTSSKGMFLSFLFQFITKYLANKTLDIFLLLRTNKHHFLGENLFLKVFATNLNFLIPISSKPDGVNLISNFSQFIEFIVWNIGLHRYRDDKFRISFPEHLWYIINKYIPKPSKD